MFVRLFESCGWVRVNGGLFGMVSLTFYGGVDEIDGNKVLLEDGDAWVFFDFGQSFTLVCVEEEF